VSYSKNSDGWATNLAAPRESFGPVGREHNVLIVRETTVIRLCTSRFPCLPPGRFRFLRDQTSLKNSFSPTVTGLVRRRQIFQITITKHTKIITMKKITIILAMALTASTAFAFTVVKQLTTGLEYI
jgi:hypothetical protein